MNLANIRFDMVSPSTFGFPADPLLAFCFWGSWDCQARLCYFGGHWPREPPRTKSSSGLHSDPEVPGNAMKTKVFDDFWRPCWPARSAWQAGLGRPEPGSGPVK